MHLFRSLVICIACLLSMPGFAQVNTDTISTSPLLSSPKVIDSTKALEARDSILQNPAPVEITEAEKNAPVKMSESSTHFVKPDSLEYSRFITIGVGFSSIANNRNDSVDFWKNGYTIGFGYGDHISRYLAYFLTIDYGNYSYDNQKYLDYYSQRFSQVANNTSLTPQQREKQADSSLAFANSYAERSKNNLKTIQVGASLLIKPVKIGKFTPYLQLGVNALFTLTNVTLVTPTQDGGYVKNQRTVFMNSSLDGSLLLLSGIGVEYPLSQQCRLFVDVKKTWGNGAWAENYGKLQWDIFTLKAGVALRIK